MTSACSIAVAARAAVRGTQRPRRPQRKYSAQEFSASAATSAFQIAGSATPVRRDLEQLIGPLVKTADPPLIVMSGLPGSGKSTVACALAPLMDLPVIDKDTILERLFDSKGIGNSAWRRQLSRESDATLQSEVSQSNGAVVSSFWHLPGMPPDSGTPTEWLADLSRAIVQVRCVCPPEVAARRFMRRARHPGHLDGKRSAAEVLASIEALVHLGPLTLGELVAVDTTQPVAADAVLRDVRTALARCLTRPAADDGAAGMRRRS